MRSRRALGAFLVASLVWMITIALAPPAHASATGGPRSLSPCSSFQEIADVSTYQGHIDWPAYRAQRAGAIIKLGGADGGLYRDGRAIENVFGATAAGVLYGGYYFSDPRPGDAEAEARHFVSIGAGKGTLPDQLDLEYNRHGMSGAQLDQWALDFAAEYHRLVAHELDIYGGAYFAGWGNDPRLPGTFGLWIPAYLAGYDVNPNPCARGWPAVPNAWGNKGFDVYQFTSSNTAAGIGGHVDMSIVPPEVWAEWTGTTTAPAQDPTTDVPAGPNQLVYGPGARGPKVAQIQAITGAHVDGIYGPDTASHVRAWQRFLGVPADGVWSEQTERATAELFNALASLPPIDQTPPPPDIYRPPTNEPTVRFGSRGRAVCDLQHALNDRGFGLDRFPWETCVDGPETNNAVWVWQQRNGLPADAVVGPRTWGSLR